VVFFRFFENNLLLLNARFLRRVIVSKKAVIVKLTQTKLALAQKCERQIKATKSKPRQQTLKRQADRFRRQAEQLARM
jgi:hypothetical protein